MLQKVGVLSIMVAVLLSIVACGPTDTNIKTEAQAIGHIQNYLKGEVRNGLNCWDRYDGSDYWAAVKHESYESRYGRGVIEVYEWKVMTMVSTGTFEEWTARSILDFILGT